MKNLDEQRRFENLWGVMLITLIFWSIFFLSVLRICSSVIANQVILVPIAEFNVILLTILFYAIIATLLIWWGGWKTGILLSLSFVFVTINIFLCYATFDAAALYFLPERYADRVICTNWFFTFVKVGWPSYQLEHLISESCKQAGLDTSLLSSSEKRSIAVCRTPESIQIAIDAIVENHSTFYYKAYESVCLKPLIGSWTPQQLAGTALVVTVTIFSIYSIYSSVSGYWYGGSNVKQTVLPDNIVTQTELNTSLGTLHTEMNAAIGTLQNDYNSVLRTVAEVQAQNKMSLTISKGVYAEFTDFRRTSGNIGFQIMSDPAVRNNLSSGNQTLLNKYFKALVDIV